MMNDLSRLDDEIKTAEVQLGRAQNRVDQLKSQRRKVLAAAWLIANNFTLDEVEDSSGDEKPYFGHITPFGEWLRKESTKRFAEWNGRIYFRSELADGRMCPNAPSLDDLRNAMA